MIQFEVRCEGCCRLLEEPPELAADERRPCPSCGSLGRQRLVLMVPGEAAAAAGSAEAAWLDLGAGLARAASALDQLLGEDLDDEKRARLASSRSDIGEALEEYRKAVKKLREL